MRLDYLYVRHRSVVEDLAIMTDTIPRSSRDAGRCEDGTGPCPRRRFSRRSAVFQATCSQLTDGLLDRGWQVSVAGPAAAIESWGLHARGAGAQPLSLARGPRPLRDAREVARLAEHIRRAKVDLVHTHSSKAGLVAGLAARRAGVPVVHTPHSWAFEMRSPRPVRGTFAAMERALTRRCRSAIVAVSDYEQRVALDRGVAGRDHDRGPHRDCPPPGCARAGPRLAHS